MSNAPSSSRLIWRGIPKFASEKDIIGHIQRLCGASLICTDCRVMLHEGKTRRIGYVGFKTEQDAGACKKACNGTYMATSKIAVDYAYTEKSGLIDRPWSKITKKKKSGENAEAVKSTMAREVAAATDSGRVRILNLPYETTEEELTSFMSSIGKVVDVRLLKGMGFVTYAFAAHAGQAVAELDDSLFQGRRLYIKAADDSTESDPIDKVMSKQSSKAKQRILSKKLEKNLDERNWNLLYVSASVATDLMAKHLGIKVEDMMNNTSDSVAARVALSESYVVNETKKWLSSLGIPEEVFVRQGNSLLSAKTTMATKSLSTKTLFLKHLGPWVDEEDLTSLLSKCGRIRHFSISPTKTVAVVGYDSSNHAKKALKEFALFNYKSHPLYLEYAPAIVDEHLSSKGEGEATIEEEATPTEVTSAVDGDKAVQSNSIYITNLPFETTQAEIAKIFGVCEGYKGCKLLTSRKRVRDLLTGASKDVEMSLGSGFVHFDTRSHAEEAMKKNLNLKLQQRSIVMEMAKAKQEAASKKRVIDDTELEITRRLIVKNLDFTTTVKDLRQLFSAYGSVTSCRLPRRNDGRIRGFGFVEFATINDAKTAMESLTDVHLLGRRLIIQPTSDEPDAN